jgi:hypothetical protein
MACVVVGHAGPPPSFRVLLDWRDRPAILCRYFAARRGTPHLAARRLTVFGRGASKKNKAEHALTKRMWKTVHREGRASTFSLPAKRLTLGYVGCKIIWFGPNYEHQTTGLRGAANKRTRRPGAFSNDEERRHDPTGLF